MYYLLLSSAISSSPSGIIGAEMLSGGCCCVRITDDLLALMGRKYVSNIVNNVRNRELQQILMDKHGNIIRQLPD